MSTIKNVIKYNSFSLTRAVLVLSGVMLGIGILTKAMVISFTADSPGFNGFEITFAIFLFVSFIAIFGSNFNHLNICGVTRKAFYTGNLLFALVAVVGMLALYGILAVIYSMLGIGVNSTLVMAYRTNSIALVVVFSASLFLLCAMFGWLLSLLGYRFGTPMIIALAVSPAVLFTIVPVVIIRFGLGDAAAEFIKFYFGFRNGPSPLLAGLNFLITAVIFALINWLLMRKLPVKM